MLVPMRTLCRICTSARGITTSVVRSAKVTPPNPFVGSQSVANSDPATLLDTGGGSRAALLLKRERKLKEYEAKVKIKAAQRGISVEELTAQAIAAKGLVQPATGGSSKSNVERQDLKVVEAIQKRSQAEAARKLASGQLQSTPTGAQEGPVKPLSKILDVEKVGEQDAVTVGKLWTAYHTIKNKLSGVIAHDKYIEMVTKAKRFPQFVLPLPRTVVDGEQEAKEAFEMNFLEWAILPSATTKVPASTTMFTPLAEYKLKQDFSQPVLILTHYTDLAESHGIVLMRGEITGLNEQTGKGGRIDQKEAQLLSLTLQRFYLPAKNSDGEACAKLLETFHTTPEQFDVEKLVETAYKL